SFIERTFFISSRRRHTRWPRDWSSDVCSSDLNSVDVDRVLERQFADVSLSQRSLQRDLGHLLLLNSFSPRSHGGHGEAENKQYRSEERRVGKECRNLSSPHR